VVTAARTPRRRFVIDCLSANGALVRLDTRFGDSSPPSADDRNFPKANSFLFRNSCFQLRTSMDPPVETMTDAGPTALVNPHNSLIHGTELTLRLALTD
jgi:hypothetical protein